MTVYRRPRELGWVLKSVNASGDLLCVDFFQRADDGFGYEEYRRDTETGEGWFPVGFHSQRKFETLWQAMQDARARLAWLEDEM